MARQELELASALDDESVADTETDIPNMADFPADTADGDRAGRAICNSRNLLPTTSRRRPGSKPTGNIDNAIARRPHFAA